MGGEKRARDYMGDMRLLRDVVVEIASDERDRVAKIQHFSRVYPELARDRPGIFMMACMEPADPALAGRLMEPFIDRDDGKISDEEATRRYCRLFMERDMPGMLAVVDRAEAEKDT